jgi:hypothetical protein
MKDFKAIMSVFQQGLLPAFAGFEGFATLVQGFGTPCFDLIDQISFVSAGVEAPTPACEGFLYWCS